MIVPCWLCERQVYPGDPKDVMNGKTVHRSCYYDFFEDCTGSVGGERTMTLPSLRCCTPTAAAAGSSTLVHGPLCETPERLLNDEEYLLWRSKLTHPARGGNVVWFPPVVTQPVIKARPPRRRPEKWNVGFRDPAWEDFS